MVEDTIREVISCTRCGQFECTREINAEYHISNREEVAAVVRELTLKKKKLLIVDERPNRRDQQGFLILTVEDLRRLFPKSINEILDRTLLNLSRMCSDFGHEIWLKEDIHISVAYAKSNLSMRYVLRALDHGELIELRSPRQRPVTPSHDVGCLILPAGYVRIAELERGAPSPESAQAFVAMWFGNDDHFEGKASCDWCSEVYEEALSKGVEAAGYVAHRVDMREFNDQITDEIIAEIRRSKFIVSDFTGQRGGVYYETGFARGLGMQVIHTCFKKHLNQTHFDLNHYNFIVWSTLDELKEKLQRRIEATIGLGPLRPIRTAS